MVRRIDCRQPDLSCAIFECGFDREGIDPAYLMVASDAAKNIEIRHNLAGQGGEPAGREVMSLDADSSHPVEFCLVREFDWILNPRIKIRAVMNMYVHGPFQQFKIRARHQVLSNFH